jgi:RNA polymerase-binding protein DksA
MTNTKYKEILKKELEHLKTELQDLGYANPSNSADWMAKGEEVVETADPNILADADEEQEVNKAVVSELEVRLQEVHHALERINDGTYGTCEKCNIDINPARLEANPAATTCIKCA